MKSQIRFIYENGPSFGWIAIFANYQFDKRTSFGGVNFYGEPAIWWEPTSGHLTPREKSPIYTEVMTPGVDMELNTIFKRKLKLKSENVAFIHIFLVYVNIHYLLQDGFILAYPIPAFR